MNLNARLNPYARVALLALIVVTILPTACVPIPAMVDYPNHLARMSILARADTPQAHPLYVVAWGLYPNLAMDLLVPTIGRWVGVELATKSFLILAQLLVISGAVALSWTVQRRIVISALVACLLLYANPFALGLLNFMFGLGIALWGFAVWIWLADSPSPVRAAVHTLFVVVLFLSHLFALGIYGIAIGTWQLWLFAKASPGIRQGACTFLFMGLPVAALVTILAVAGGSVGGSGTTWNAGMKVVWLMLVDGYGLVAAVPLTLALVLLAYRSVRSGWLKLPGPGPWIALAFGALFLAMPFRLFDTGFVDGRVLIAGLLILPAFLVYEPPDALERRLSTGALVGLVLVHLGYVTWVQQRYDTVFAALRASFERMPRQSRMLISADNEAWDPPANLLDYPLYHAGTLAVHTRDAFVPTLFAYPGKQPILPRTDVASIALMEGRPIPFADIARYANGAEVPPDDRYVAHWTRDFDYLLLLWPTEEEQLPSILELVTSGPQFALYRVKTRDARPVR